MQKRTLRAQNGASGRGRKGSLWRLAAADAGRRNRANGTWRAYRKEALYRKNLRVRGGDCRHLIQCFCTRLRSCAGCGQTADGQGKTAAPDFLLHGGIPTVSRLFVSLSRRFSGAPLPAALAACLWGGGEGRPFARRLPALSPCFIPVGGEAESVLLLLQIFMRFVIIDCKQGNCAHNHKGAGQ